MRPGSRGLPHQSPGSKGACSTALGTRWPGRPRLSATRRPVASLRTRMAAARSFSCSMACFRTSMAIIRPVLMSVIRQPRATHRALRRDACFSSSCGSSIWRTAQRCAATLRRWRTRMRKVEPGVETAALFHDSREDVRVERWAPNACGYARTSRTAANFWCSMARLGKAARNSRRNPGCGFHGRGGSAPPLAGRLHPLGQDRPSPPHPGPARRRSMNETVARPTVQAPDVRFGGTKRRPCNKPDRPVRISYPTFGGAFGAAAWAVSSRPHARDYTAGVPPNAASCGTRWRSTPRCRFRLAGLALTRFLACARIDRGTVRPRTLAVSRLMTKSNLSGLLDGQVGRSGSTSFAG